MGPEPFRCELWFDESGWHVQLFGELDVAARPQADAIIRLVNGNRADLVLDLSGLTFIDSTGLRMIVELARRSERDGKPLSVVEGGSAVRDVLRISGIDTLLHR